MLASTFSQGINRKKNSWRKGFLRLIFGLIGSQNGELKEWPRTM